MHETLPLIKRHQEDMLHLEERRRNLTKTLQDEWDRLDRSLERRLDRLTGTDPAPAPLTAKFKGLFSFLL